MRVGVKYRRLGSIFVLTWLLIASIILFLPAWSQTTQTVTYNPVDDALADYNNPDTNYGSDTILTISGSVYSGIYLKFDLSDFTLPVERIVSVKLRIYNPTDNAANTVKACGVADDSWQEETLTYNNKPGRSSSCSDPVDAQANNWMELNITAFFSEFVSSSDKSFSIVVALGSGISEVSVATKEYAESQYWPELVIEYEPYTETTTQTITETVTETVTDTLTTTVTETYYNDTITTTTTTYQTMTNIITETATTTITQTEWANQTVTTIITMTPTVTLGNQTINYYTDLANQLIPLVMVIGVICTMLSLLLSATKR